TLWMVALVYFCFVYVQFGCLVWIPTFPADILSRKLTATGMGFLATFTSASGIVTTPFSGKIVDMFHSYGAVFFSFAVVALAGTVVALFISENTSEP
ncbi:MAG: hypothetical protein U9Q05_04160, partial [Thermodesulfobacteriota bacterium]|nr:hypothetical protein [Thermodesulfobacteriota bacterium]